eukprot:4739501-Alexandrium_andersonii.AAC.1
MYLPQGRSPEGRLRARLGRPFWKPSKTTPRKAALNRLRPWGGARRDAFERLGRPKSALF